MSNKQYEISMEIAGPFAMWARPDTGSTPTSYPIPTWSAAKGLLESIAFLRDGKAWINPIRVEICKPKNSERGEVFFQKYTNNYRGPLQSNKDGAFQLSALILADVCYRIYAVIEIDSTKNLKENPCHYLQDLFQRRLRQGRCHKTPCLGWNEFVASYWGEIREQETEVDTRINLELVSVLYKVFNNNISQKCPENNCLVDTRYQPIYQKGEKARIVKVYL